MRHCALKAANGYRWYLTQWGGTLYLIAQQRCTDDRGKVYFRDLPNRLEFETTWERDEFVAGCSAAQWVAQQAQKPNETITGRLFARFATADGGDFEFFVRCRRSSGQWPEFELALAIKDRIPDMRIEDVLRDMATVKESR